MAINFSRPTFKLGDRLPSAVCDCLFIIFLAALLFISRRPLHPQPDNAPYRPGRWPT